MTARLPRTALAAGLTTAALTLSLTACGNDDGSQTADDPATPSTGATAATTDPPSSATTSTTTPPASEYTYAVYDVGATPQGPRLYREFRSGAGDASPDAALATALTGLSDTPTDPDYGTLWPTGVLSDAHLADGQIDVTVDSSVVQRPSDVSAAQAELAVQQVVYTLQAAAQRRLPVRFQSGDAPAATVFGVPTADPVEAADELATLALVNVTTPVQGQAVSGSFTASGVASSFEGTVAWTVLDGAGTEVLHGSAQTQGDYTQLTPWQATVDATTLQPGDYTFVASSGAGGEGPGPTKDTKAFTVS